MRPLCAAIAMFVLLAACGGEPTDNRADPTDVSVEGDEPACDEFVSFHGDPAPDTKGTDSPEEAIAEAAAPYGTPSLAEETGDISTWNINDDNGLLIGTIEIVPAPAGGFIGGEHELCAFAEQAHNEGEEGGTMMASGAPSAVVNPLPDLDEWTAPDQGGEHPLHLLVDFSVGEGFEPLEIAVWIDDDLVVSGQGWHRSEFHCNWWGPYDLDLASGTHNVEIHSEDGLELTEAFNLNAESTAIANYTDPSFSDETEASLAWYVHDGQPGCD